MLLCVLFFYNGLMAPNWKINVYLDEATVGGNAL